MKQRIPAALSAIVLALAAGPAAAQVVNGDFNGLAGWSVGGDGAAIGGKLVLTNASYANVDDNVNGADLPAGARNVSHDEPLAAGFDLENFVGVPIGSFDPDPANFVTAMEGSAARQTFFSAAGSTLTFRWDLGTLDASTDPATADVAFVVIDGHVTTLANTLAATLASSDADYLTHTGWTDWSTTFASAGEHTIAFGVVDIGNFGNTSALSISDVGVAIPSVPEPSAMALLAAGLGLLGLQARRRRRA